MLQCITSLSIALAYCLLVAWRIEDSFLTDWYWRYDAWHTRHLGTGHLGYLMVRCLTASFIVAGGLALGYVTSFLLFR